MWTKTRVCQKWTKTCSVRNSQLTQMVCLRTIKYNVLFTLESPQGAHGANSAENNSECQKLGQKAKLAENYSFE